MIIINQPNTSYALLHHHCCNSLTNNDFVAFILTWGQQEFSKQSLCEFWIKTRKWIHSYLWISLHKFLPFGTTYLCEVAFPKLTIIHFKKWSFLILKMLKVLRPVFSMNGWYVKKSSTASIPLVLLDIVYKLNWFLLIFYSLYCFHYMVVLLLYIVTFVEYVHLYSVILP